MKKQNITYVSYASKMLAEAEIRDFNYRLNSIKKALATKGEDTIEEFMAYQADPTHKRSKVLSECEAWMDASHCPDFLREENRQRAWHSLDNDFIAKMHADGKLVWVNSIIYDYKKQIAAGHSDDTALTESEDKGWGWLADKGFDFIQTDWPQMLIGYLKASGKYYR